MIKKLFLFYLILLPLWGYNQQKGVNNNIPFGKNNPLTINGKVINSISTDNTLSEESDSNLVTEKAIKTYVDNSKFFVSVKDFGAKGDNSNDDTKAIQAAFNYATQHGRKVFIPGGTYLVGELKFGSQRTNGQSSTPLGIEGEGWVSSLKAKPGFTGTILKAWSIAGVVFRDFEINGNHTASSCIDVSWKQGAGPSCQNRYEYLRCRDAKDTVFIAVNNNDCVFDQCVITAMGHDKVALDIRASGGLVWIRDCIWNNGYLLIGCQNGSISNSWGHGILMSDGCLNYLQINSCYLYANSYLDAVIKSKSFKSFQSIRSLVCIATQFISDGNVIPSSYFSLNAYSTLDFWGCQFIGKCKKMFSDSCRNDSYDPVRVLFRGGSSSDIALNKPNGFIIEVQGFMNDKTGHNFKN